MNRAPGAVEDRRVPCLPRITRLRRRVTDARAPTNAVLSGRHADGRVLLLDAWSGHGSVAAAPRPPITRRCSASALTGAKEAYFRIARVRQSGPRLIFVVQRRYDGPAGTELTPAPLLLLVWERRRLVGVLKIGPADRPKQRRESREAGSWSHRHMRRRAQRFLGRQGSAGVNEVIVVRNDHRCQAVRHGDHATSGCFWITPREVAAGRPGPPATNAGLLMSS
jgi:hypothetical protein